MRDSVPQTLAGRRRRIVIVTPMHLSANPRVVKEADALSAGDFDVHVVFAQRSAGVARDHDEEMSKGRSWGSTAVREARTKGELAKWFVGAGRQRLSRAMPRHLWRISKTAEYATGRVLPSLMRVAADLGADLFIGHYAEGLAAAGMASARTGAILGFDAEDYHIGEPNGADEISRTDFIQSRYLPRCRWVTAASDGIGSALVDRYGIGTPITINNAFPLSDRQEIDGLRRDRRRNDILSLYWYSQTIGLDRGIQDAIRAAGRLQGPVEIHLRGRVENEVRRALEHLAREWNVQETLFFHDPVSPVELLSRASEHDVGLALEHPITSNRAICVSNKLFMYLLAGLAIAATNVPGQVKVLESNGESSAWYPPGDHEALAVILERWRSDRAALVRAKRAALEAASRRWNWEYESQLLVRSARAIFESPTCGSGWAVDEEAGAA